MIRDLMVLIRSANVPLTAIVAFVLFLYAIRPKLMFHDGKKRRAFGLGYDRDREKKTLFDVTVVVMVVAMIFGIVL